ncbi:MAG TPA: glycosyl transferase, partial [Methylocella sp.]|nr:glycosyl transferase [Methylocella sp.]
MEFARFLQIACEAVLIAAALGLLFVGGSFLILIGINIAEHITGRRLGKPLLKAPLSDACLPHVLVQIPVYNEPEMVADCLRSAAALDWPREKLHIQILD